MGREWNPRTLLLREIAGLRFSSDLEPLLALNGLDRLTDIDLWRTLSIHGDAHRELRDRAFLAFSDRGGYPLVHARPDVPWPEVADQLNENVIRRVIQHDLRLGERGRKPDPQLLEEVFRLACRYAGQAPSQATLVEELRQVLRANIGWQRIRSYLSDLAHFPERPTEPEIDYVLAIGEKRIPLEVKCRRRIDPLRDSVGLRSFIERTHYNAPFGILVTMLDQVQVSDPRIVPISLRSLLLLR